MYMLRGIKSDAKIHILVEFYIHFNCFLTCISIILTDMNIAKDVNIGSVIKKILSEKKISQAEFGRTIHVSQTQITRLLKKETIDTDSLMELCHMLSHNFFEEFVPKAEKSSNGQYNDLETIMKEENRERSGYTLNNVHIGKCIINELKKMKVTQAELGNYMGVTHQEVSRLLKNESIDTGKLVKISNFLGHNFFRDFYTWCSLDDIKEAHKCDSIMYDHICSPGIHTSISEMLRDPKIDQHRYTIKNMLLTMIELYEENKELKEELKKQKDSHQ